MCVWCVCGVCGVCVCALFEEPVMTEREVFVVLCLADNHGGAVQANALVPSHLSRLLHPNQLQRCL